MKVLQHLFTRHNTAASANGFSHMQRISVGKNISGAFLFLAFAAFLIYGTAPTNQTSAVNSHKGTTKAADTLRLQTTPSASASTNASPEQSASTSQTGQGSGDGSSTSTNVTTTNGVTSVTVNGQPVATNDDGSMHKTITTSNGTVQISVNQTSTNGTSGSTASNSTVDPISAANQNALMMLQMQQNMDMNNN